MAATPARKGKKPAAPAPVSRPAAKAPRKRTSSVAQMHADMKDAALAAVAEREVKARTAPKAPTKLALALEPLIAEFGGGLDGIEAIRDALHALSPNRSQPVDRVRWVPIEKVTPNDYNPNSVAQKEMGLLYHSIKHDGYTQPVVTVWNPERGLYEIVDGFHRYFTCKTNPDILARNNGCLPIVVIDKDINDRMASTVRHNRARGKHSVQGMSNMVFEMLENGWEDAAICNELGMEPEELLRLKHITGFSKLFADVEYKKAWVTRRQILIQKRFEESQRAGTAPTAPARAPAKRGKASAVPKRSAEALPA